MYTEASLTLSLIIRQGHLLYEHLSCINVKTFYNSPIFYLPRIWMKPIFFLSISSILPFPEVKDFSLAIFQISDYRQLLISLQILGPIFQYMGWRVAAQQWTGHDQNSLADQTIVTANWQLGWPRICHGIMHLLVHIY